MQSRQFPKGQGLAFSVEITESGSTVDIPAFVFEVNSKQYPMAAETFTLADGDTVYITPSGLARMAYDQDAKSTPYPADRFDNGVAYWLVQRVNGENIRLEV